MAPFNQSLQTEVVAGQSIDYVEMCLVLKDGGGVFNETTV